MYLVFALNEDKDILNTTIRDEDTGSILYTVDTSKQGGGVLTTTVADGESTEPVYRILWNGGEGSLDYAQVEMGSGSSGKKPATETLGRDLMERVPDRGSTYGLLSFFGKVYEWKRTGSKVALVADNGRATVARSHGRGWKTCFKRPHDIGLEVSESDVVRPFLDLILITFILVWTERQSERIKSAQ